MSEDRVLHKFWSFSGPPNPSKGVYLEKLIKIDPKTNKNGPKTLHFDYKNGG